MSSDVAFKAWDLPIGVISIFTAIPVAVHLVYTQLPSRKLEVLFKTLSDTNTLFDSSIEEGLLRHHHVEEFREHLKTLRKRAEAIRFQVHAARSCGEDFTNLLSGLTGKINDVCDEVKDVRANISTTSTREREERELVAARNAELQNTATDSSLSETTNASARTAGKRLWSFLTSSLSAAQAILRSTSSHDTGSTASLGGLDGTADSAPPTSYESTGSPLDSPPLTSSSTGASGSDTDGSDSSQRTLGPTRICCCGMCPTPSSHGRAAYRNKTKIGMRKGKPLSSGRRPDRRYRHAPSTQVQDALMIPMAMLSAIEYLHSDDEEEWEDVVSQLVQSSA